MQLDIPDDGTPEYKKLHTQVCSAINALRPDDRYLAGRKFFTLLLEHQGVKGVYSFVYRAQKIIQENRKLETADINDSESDAFKKAHPRLLSRRAMFRVLGEGVGGAGLALYGLAGMRDQMARSLQPAQTKNQAQTETTCAIDGPTDSWEHAMTLNVMPEIYTIIGAGMVYDSYHHYMEFKLGDIANALTQLSKTLPSIGTHQQRVYTSEGIKGLSC